MRNVIRTLVFASCLVALSTSAPADPPARAEDDVAIVFRRETHLFTGKDRENLVRTAAKLLSDARISPPLAEDDSEHKQLTAIRERSCMTIRFAKPPTENVESLVIPFSPDLDPQTLYALSGPHVRRLTHFANRTCDDLRAMLVHAGIYPPAPGATVTGTVRVVGKPPEPRVWDTDAAIRERFGLTRYTEETWLVGPDNGLRNCVVTLRDRDADRRMTPRPRAKSAIGKDMVCYNPRVLVVTPDTPITLDNVDSPCRGFMIAGRRNQFSYMIGEATEQTVRLKGPDLCQVTCPVRPYARGWIHVADTPYFAVTDINGRFTIRGVPDGKYDVTVWHEAAGKVKTDAGPTQIEVRDAGEVKAEYKVTVGVQK